MHNSIVHTEHGFPGVPVAVADRGKRNDVRVVVVDEGGHTMCLPSVTGNVVVNGS